MAGTSMDTDDDAARVQRAVWARMGLARKLELTLRMSDEVRELAIDGEMARHPEFSRDQAKHVVIRRMLGDELYRAAYGER